MPKKKHGWVEIVERGEVMRNLPVRKCSIRMQPEKLIPEQITPGEKPATWGVYEDNGSHYVIYSSAGLGGFRVLSKDEAVNFWEKVKQEWK